MKYILRLTTALALALCALQTGLQWQESAFIHDLANQIVSDAGATTEREKVIAVRDYIRSHVTYVGAEYDHRPWLRDTAAKTLTTGKGYCGEDTRAFINLARSLGIDAQRMNLYGPFMHVVAEVHFSSGEDLLVDCQQPPQIVELESADEAMQSPNYDGYATLNLHRFGLGSAAPRSRLRLGPLTFWLENPHAIQAAFWGLLAAALWLPRKMIAALRRPRAAPIEPPGRIA